jgi:hypothetical protein
MCLPTVLDILLDMHNETNIRIFQSAKSELMRHMWDTVVGNPPSVAAGGLGVVIPGCPACRSRLKLEDRRDL